MNEVWDLDKVHQVQKLYYNLDFNEDAMFADVARAAEMIDGYQKNVAQGLVNIAKRVSDAEISVYDINFSAFDHVDEPLMTLTGNWSPVTTNIMLRGGPEDGRIASVKNIGDIYQSGKSPQEYALAGWNSQSRHWIYDLLQGGADGPSQLHP